MDRVQAIMRKRLETQGFLKARGEFRQGDTVKVFTRVKEGEKERTQIYQGVVIKMQGSGVTRSFTVRKMSFGVGVERTFPYNSSKVDKVEIVKKGKTRRSRLYFLRDLTGRKARLQSDMSDQNAAEAAQAAAPATTDAATSEAAPAKKAKKTKAKKD
jgi:large subunit ribosomal protein L19